MKIVNVSVFDFLSFAKVFEFSDIIKDFSDKEKIMFPYLVFFFSRLRVHFLIKERTVIQKKSQMFVYLAFTRL